MMPVHRKMIDGKFRDLIAYLKMDDIFDAISRPVSLSLVKHQ